MELKYHLLENESRPDGWLIQETSIGNLVSFSIWVGTWEPMPILSFSNQGHNVVFSAQGNNLYLLHGDTGVVELSSLRPVLDTEIKSLDTSATRPRFTAEIIDYVKALENDAERCQYIYSLGRAMLKWPEERTLEHLEAIRSLSSYIGDNSIGGENLADWEEFLYPLALLTDAWNALDFLKFTHIDLLDWGFSKDLALGFGEVVGVLRGGLVLENADMSCVWAAVIMLTLGTLAERSYLEDFDALVDQSKSAIELIGLNEDMMSLVETLYSQPMFPGH